MATFVLVHGGWGGGWQWRWVARILRAAGHEVTTPTLSGQGERAHLRCDGITLLTHVDDVAEHLWFEDLTDVVLVGWSYGSGPVEGVADRMPERLRMVVNLDGDLVRDGEASGIEDWPAEQLCDAQSTGWIPPPASEDLGDVLADPDLREFVAARVRPWPVAAMTTPFPDTGGRRWQVPHVYLACTEAPAGDESAEDDVAIRDATKADPRWHYRELEGVNHLAILYAPEVVADVLLDLV